MVDEGQRVLASAQALLSAIHSGSVGTLLNTVSAIDFLGRSWLEVHSECYLTAVRLHSQLVELPSNNSFKSNPRRGSA